MGFFRGRGSTVCLPVVGINGGIKRSVVTQWRSMQRISIILTISRCPPKNDHFNSLSRAQRQSLQKHLPLEPNRSFSHNCVRHGIAPGFIITAYHSQIIDDRLRGGGWACPSFVALAACQWLAYKAPRAGCPCHEKWPGSDGLGSSWSGLPIGCYEMCGSIFDHIDTVKGHPAGAVFELGPGIGGEIDRGIFSQGEHLQ